MSDAFVSVLRLLHNSSQFFPAPLAGVGTLNIVIITQQLTISSTPAYAFHYLLQTHICCLISGRPDQVSITIAYLAPGEAQNYSYLTLFRGHRGLIVDTAALPAPSPTTRLSLDPFVDIGIRLARSGISAFLRPFVVWRAHSYILYQGSSSDFPTLHEPRPSLSHSSRSGWNTFAL